MPPPRPSETGWKLAEGGPPLFQVEENAKAAQSRRSPRRDSSFGTTPDRSSGRDARRPPSRAQDSEREGSTGRGRSPDGFGNTRRNRNKGWGHATPCRHEAGSAVALRRENAPRRGCWSDTRAHRRGPSERSAVRRAWRLRGRAVSAPLMKRISY